MHRQSRSASRHRRGTSVSAVSFYPHVTGHSVRSLSLKLWLDTHLSATQLLWLGGCAWLPGIIWSLLNHPRDFAITFNKFLAMLLLYYFLKFVWVRILSLTQVWRIMQCGFNLYLKGYCSFKRVWKRSYWSTPRSWTPRCQWRNRIG